MRIKQVIWNSLFVVTLSVTTAVFADTISGTAGAAFQPWAATNLNENANPYWDNMSLDGNNKNVGFFLTDAPTAPLAGAPGPLPFWGNSFNPVTDNGGSADLNFTFQRSALTSVASLKLEVAANSNLNEFGWYNTADASVLHPIFLGADSAPASDLFSPSAQYGFYLKGSNGVFYTQSSLNPGGDTSHQHFTIFQESSTNGAEAYWLGLEDLGVSGLYGAEGSKGDYNDMLIRIAASPGSTVPEPSTALLMLGGMLTIVGLLRRR